MRSSRHSYGCPHVCPSIRPSVHLSCRSSPPQCDHCPHGPMQHFSWWNRKVSNPIVFGGSPARVQAALAVLRRDVLGRLLVRRTKRSEAGALSLPPRDLRLRLIDPSPEERDFYEAYYTRQRRVCDCHHPHHRHSHHHPHQLPSIPIHTNYPHQGPVWRLRPRRNGIEQLRSHLRATDSPPPGELSLSSLVIVVIPSHRRHP